MLSLPRLKPGNDSLQFYVCCFRVENISRRGCAVSLNFQTRPVTKKKVKRRKIRRTFSSVSTTSRVSSCIQTPGDATTISNSSGDSASLGSWHCQAKMKVFDSQDIVVIGPKPPLCSIYKTFCLVLTSKVWGKYALILFVLKCQLYFRQNIRIQK